MSSTTGGLYAKISIDDNGLTGVDAAALEAEYKARVKKKRKPAEANPRAKEAGSSDHDASTRQRRAERRRTKVHAVRNKRAAKEKADQDEAFRRVKAQARRQPSAGQPRSGTDAGTGTGTSSRRKSRRASGRVRSARGGMAAHYKVLDLPNGASRSEVKSAFRKLMRKYHPDMHTQSPKKHKAATELTMKVSAAYNALEEHFRANE